MLFMLNTTCLYAIWWSLVCAIFDSLKYNAICVKLNTTVNEWWWMQLDKDADKKQIMLIIGMEAIWLIAVLNCIVIANGNSWAATVPGQGGFIVGHCNTFARNTTESNWFVFQLHTIDNSVSSHENVYTRWTKTD